MMSFNNIGFVSLTIPVKEAEPDSYTVEDT